MTGDRAAPICWRRLYNVVELEQLGVQIAPLLSPGDAVCLSGPLGAGKTTLARSLIRALAGPDEEVPSPTFTLVQTYETPRLPIAHFDLYRLRDSQDVEELGLDEALEAGAALIEWPERLGGRLPPERLEVTLRFPEGDAIEAREIRWVGRGSWRARAQTLGCDLDA